MKIIVVFLIQTRHFRRAEPLALPPPPPASEERAWPLWTWFIENPRPQRWPNERLPASRPNQ